MSPTFRLVSFEKNVARHHSARLFVRTWCRTVQHIPSNENEGLQLLAKVPSTALREPRPFERCSPSWLRSHSGSSLPQSIGLKMSSRRASEHRLRCSAKLRNLKGSTQPCWHI